MYMDVYTSYTGDDPQCYSEEIGVVSYEEV